MTRRYKYFKPTAMLTIIYQFILLFYQVHNNIVLEVSSISTYIYIYNIWLYSLVHIKKITEKIQRECFCSHLFFRENDMHSFFYVVCL